MATFGTVLYPKRLSWYVSNHVTGSRHTQPVHLSTTLPHCHVSVWSLPTSSRNEAPSSHAKGAIRSDTKQSGHSIFSPSHDGYRMDVTTSTEYRGVGIHRACSSLSVRPAFPPTCLTNLLPHIWYIARLNTLCSLEWIKLRWSACDDVYCISEIRSVTVSPHSRLYCIQLRELHLQFVTASFDFSFAENTGSNIKEIAVLLLVILREWHDENRVFRKTFTPERDEVRVGCRKIA